jgi:hypothetical protein
MLFLDSDQPIKTCVSENCDGCAVHKSLHCHFKPIDLIHFLFISIPIFLLGGAGVYHVSGWLLLLWMCMIIGFFAFLEIRVMCSHCPHYAEPGNTLKCWANYGIPKVWEYRPGPMSFMEKLAFFAGLSVIMGYPLICMLKSMQGFLLIVYIISSVGFFMTLKMFLCSQCINFACQLNGVIESVRHAFFERNPEVAEAWGEDGKR